jgi:hypothetical protein
MRASVVTMAVNMMAAAAMIIALVVTDVRDGGAASRMSLCKRRRDDTSELGDQKEGGQKPNRARLCPEPLHELSLSRLPAGVNPARFSQGLFKVQVRD